MILYLFKMFNKLLIPPNGLNLVFLHELVQ